MKLKQIKEIRKLAESMGHTVDRVEVNKHVKLYLDTKQGKKLLTVSLTASDGRAFDNNKSILKGWAK
jgi:hypothetical protein